MSIAGALKKLTDIINTEKTHDYAKQKLTLVEDGKQAILKRLTIGGFDGDVVAVKLESIGGFADKLLKNKHHARKACDAVIFCQFENQGYILILDMKSSAPSDNDHRQQLRSGSCFSDYLLAVLEYFENIKISGWQRRYFIFHCGNNNKRATLPEYNVSPPSNCHADKAHILLVADNAEISLRKLLGKPL